MSNNYGKINPTIRWNQNPEPDVTGYVIYYGLSSNNYTANVDVGLTGTPSAPAHVIVEILAPIQRYYYFAVKAYNSSGLFSVFSDEVVYYVSDQYTRATAAKVVARRG